MSSKEDAIRRSCGNTESKFRTGIIPEGCGGLSQPRQEEISKNCAMGPIQKIPLHTIDFSDQTFSVNFLPDLARLRSSIQEVGLIQPVLLRETSNRYQIVSGFRRLSIFQELGYHEIDSRVLGERELDDLKLFSVSLHENLTTRGFNSVEKAIVLEKLVFHFRIDPSVVIREYLPLLDLEMNEKIMNTFLSLAQMEEEVKTYVLREEVSRSNIRRLAGLSADDRKATQVLLASLKLGENSLREILTLLEETAKREKGRVKEILDHPDIQAILLHPELTSTQKTERVKKVLLNLRYPRLRQLEEEFEKKKKDSNLPSHISLSHPPFFEGKGLRIGFQFHSMEEYESVLSALVALAEREEFQEMMKDLSLPPSPPRGEGRVKGN
jgi:ParB/RepB/Spo0J family partition protein